MRGTQTESAARTPYPREGGGRGHDMSAEKPGVHVK